MTTSELVIHFLVHPDERLHLRGLQRHTGLGHRSLQRKLAKLDEAERSPSRYLRAVMEGEKRWVIGEENDLPLR